jgi:hypothetical protein
MSETNSSSSSSNSASTSLSSQKQKGQSQGRRRPCLIWNTESEGIEVLPIASFGGKDLAKIKTDIPCTISSKDFFKYVLSIHPITPPPNKRSLRPKTINNIPIEMWNVHDHQYRTNNICEGMYILLF